MENHTNELEWIYNTQKKWYNIIWNIKKTKFDPQFWAAYSIFVVVVVALLYFLPNWFVHCIFWAKSGVVYGTEISNTWPKTNNNSEKSNCVAYKRSNMLILWHCVTQLHALMLWVSEQRDCFVHWNAWNFCPSHMTNDLRLLASAQRKKRP